eukprot:2500890-Ditylum_brightwellii.AAC.1
MHRQAYWKQILQINTTEGTEDILTDFMLIDEDDHIGARLKHSPKRQQQQKVCTSHCGNHLLAQSRQRCRCTLITMKSMVQPFCITFLGSTPEQLNLSSGPIS